MKKGTRIKKLYRLTYLNERIEFVKRFIWKIKNTDEPIDPQELGLGNLEEVEAYLDGLQDAKEFIRK